MKISRELVKQFEKEQKESGTKVAICNLYWLLGAYLMRQAGVKRIRTSYKKLPTI